MSPSPPGASGRKSFAAPEQYRSTIGRLVPGHALLSPLAIAELVAAGPEVRRVLVVGCGPGDELIALARALPAAEIHGVDVSAEMVAHARDAVAGSGLAARVRVDQGPIEPDAYDAASCLLVLHLLAADVRAQVLADVAAGVRPSGLLVTAEIETVGPTHLAVWLAWAEAAGLPRQRLPVLRRRLTEEFVTLDEDDVVGSLARAGFRPAGHPLAILAVHLRKIGRAHV